MNKFTLSVALLLAVGSVNASDGRLRKTCIESIELMKLHSGSYSKYSKYGEYLNSKLGSELLENCSTPLLQFLASPENYNEWLTVQQLPVVPQRQQVSRAPVASQRRQETERDALINLIADYKSQNKIFNASSNKGFDEYLKFFGIDSIRLLDDLSDQELERLADLNNFEHWKREQEETRVAKAVCSAVPHVPVASQRQLETSSVLPRNYMQEREREEKNRQRNRQRIVEEFRRMYDEEEQAHITRSGEVPYVSPIHMSEEVVNKKKEEQLHKDRQDKDYLRDFPKDKRREIAEGLYKGRAFAKLVNDITEYGEWKGESVRFSEEEQREFLAKYEDLAMKRLERIIASIEEEEEGRQLQTQAVVSGVSFVTAPAAAAVVYRPEVVQVPSVTPLVAAAAQQPALNQDEENMQRAIEESRHMHNKEEQARKAIMDQQDAEFIEIQRRDREKTAARKAQEALEQKAREQIEATGRLEEAARQVQAEKDDVLSPAEEKQQILRTARLARFAQRPTAPAIVTPARVVSVPVPAKVAASTKKQSFINRFFKSKKVLPSAPTQASQLLQLPQPRVLPLFEGAVDWEEDPFLNGGGIDE